MSSMYGADLFQALQKKPERMRNICILAHVDHGKTTLSDSLISTNGIISERLAGTIRYMDSRPDEQQRRITMKSSCITLLHRYVLKGEGEKGFLINLIDSPGHVDFGMEVSTAVRVCDGALVLVDVVEGVSSQTRAVLRQAWLEKVRPTLVLNKMDRLITDLGMTALEAYEHMRTIVEQANVVMSEFNTEDLFERIVEDAEMGDDEFLSFDWNETAEDAGIFFSPTQGNVVFGSAYDGWAFGIQQFVDIFAKKMGCRREVLQKTLWGGYYYHPKQRKIVKDDNKGNLKPMFVSMILDNIWAVYAASQQTGDKSRIEKIVTTLDLKVPPRDLKNKDPKVVMKSVFSKWLPLSKAVLDMVIERLPSPLEAQSVRLPKVVPLLSDEAFGDTVSTLASIEGASDELTDLKKSIVECDASGQTVVFLSKMFSIERAAIPRKTVVDTSRKPRPAAKQEERKPEVRASSTENGFDDLYAVSATTVVPEIGARAAAGSPITSSPRETKVEDVEEESASVMIGLCRIFSGTIRRGDTVHVLGPKYNAAFPDKFRSEVTVDGLFILMGRDLMYADEVSAGAVFGISGLDSVVFGTATLCTTSACPSFLRLQQVSPPIVRVAVEPKVPGFDNFKILQEGLRRLNQSDPGVECIVQSTGELVVAASGELHLERCLRDLREDYAKIAIVVSPPLVAFRETIVEPPPDVPREADPVGMASTANKKMVMYVRAMPLPAQIVKYLEENADKLRIAFSEDSAEGSAARHARMEVRESLCGLLPLLEDAPLWKDLDLRRVWSFGPQQCGPNLLLNALPNDLALNLGALARDVEGSINGSGRLGTSAMVVEREGDIATEKLVADLQRSIVAGFQMGTSTGPLCEEPLCGVAFALEDVRILDEVDASMRDQYGPFSGQVIPAMSSACRVALDKQPRRLMEAVFLCNMQTHADSLGKFFAVIAQRRGKILNEEMREGTMIFNIQCLLPVVESFGLADSLRTRTSGLAVPQMVFDGFRLITLDPFWVPTTVEELEHHGDLGHEVSNYARKYMDDVRRRKGLAVEEKIVEFGDKQRTLGKNK